MTKLTVVLALTYPIFASVATRTERGALYVTPDKQVEALELQITGPQPYKQWAIQLDAPLIPAGQEHAIKFHGEDVFVLSVAYSDGSYDGGLAAKRLVSFRDDLVARRPVDVQKCDCGGAALMLIKQAQHRGWVVRTAEARPNTGFPYFVAGSMTAVSNLGWAWLDWAGNPEWQGGFVGAGTIFVSGKASCPTWVGLRPFIAASASEGTNCQQADMNGSVEALYGPTGTGGTAAQRFGVLAGVEISNIPQGDFQGVIVDSCSFSQPEVLSPGGGGYCN